MIRNETVCKMVGVAPIEEKSRENRLRWFRHIHRRSEDAVVKRADRIVLDSNVTGRSRPKLTLDAMMRKDMSILGPCEQVALDIAQWKKMIHVTDSK
ncbi:hypothetical protein RHMOL_Rhmol01G0173400 [Rhododendron molle]|uniref:Uncharacterized protein n=1 Tax=Rhododendron molle TaxID=49168 RepID=A0ACC0Q417_RHOML|nr:hypothetical protein RHMOL_Rhmol01G0173400 [Rhododendron molle]